MVRYQNIRTLARCYLVEHTTSLALVAALAIVYSDKELSIYQFLVYFRSSITTDLRDKIYSLIGLAHLPPDQFVVDYSVTWLKVFKRISVYIIQTSSGRLDIVVYSGSTHQGPSIPGHQTGPTYPHFKIITDLTLATGGMNELSERKCIDCAGRPIPILRARFQPFDCARHHSHHRR